MTIMLEKYFVRQIPKQSDYIERYKREIKLIKKFKFEQVFLQVREILDLVPDYRWITRGSAGCSLIGYLLGIHNMDPIKNKFMLSRFMHENRPDLPDIDIDFDYQQRDLVLEKVKEKYPGRVGRISNYVKYQPNSAARQALREVGHRTFLPKYYDLEKVAGKRLEAIFSRTQQLIGQHKNYSLHCGGIVIFPDAIPEEYRLKNDQLKIDKNEVEEKGLFKIDLLCNRGLAQMNELSNRPLESYPEYDDATSKMFRSGNSWGVTFAESPAQRRLHKDIQPISRKDIIFSLALIRPLPSADGRRVKVLEQFHRERNHDGHLIYDDDGIVFIQKILGCSESEAELYRKAFGKKNAVKINEFYLRIKHRNDHDEIMRELGYFSLYSFCHAHATSYGNLVWALGYEKVRQPKKFWWAALNHAQSMYRPWVHVQEAKKAGLKFASFGRGPWKLIGDELHPTHYDMIQGDGWYQYKKRKYWISDRFMPGMFYHINNKKTVFKGLIATGRHHNVNGRNITFVTIGTNTGEYLDLVLNGTHEFDRYDTIEGEGIFSNDSVQVHTFCFTKLEHEPSQKLLFALD